MRRFLIKPARIRGPQLLGLILITLSGLVMANPAAPALDGTSLDDQPLTFHAGERQHPALLVFWASWCPTCMSEIPAMKQAYQQHADTLEFIGVNLDSVAAKGLAVQQNRALPYPSFKDENRRITSQYGVHGTPTLVIINTQGEVAYTTNRLHKALNWLNKTSM